MSKKKKKKKEKKIQGAALKPARGKRPWTGLQDFVLFYRQRRKIKKYNIRRIILCQKMEKDAQEIHIHSHR